MDIGDVKFLAPAKLLTLSESIVAGRPFISEDTTYFGCALCSAYYMRTGENLGRSSGDGDYLGHFIRAFPEVPLPIATTVSMMHYTGKSDAECASFAASQGY